MRILGLDPASTCGWALLVDGSYHSGGAEKFSHPSKSKLRKGQAHVGDKWLAFARWIPALLVSTSPDVVIIEDVKRNTSTLAGHAYGFFRYTIAAACASSGIQMMPVGVGEWKKDVTGKGNAEKEDVQAAVDAIYGPIEYRSLDHSDALGIAHSGVLRLVAVDEANRK